MRVAILIMLLAALGMSCEKFDDGTSRLRIENISMYDYSALTVHGLGFGDLPVGQTTQYLLVEELFASISISLRADTVDLASIVIDHVGETPLRSGDFTLQVNVNGDLDRGAFLTQNLVRD